MVALSPILFPYTTLFRSEGAVVPVGQTIAWIVAPGEALPAEAVPSSTTTTLSATVPARAAVGVAHTPHQDRKSTRLNSSHLGISYAVFCLKKKNLKIIIR